MAKPAAKPAPAKTTPPPAPLVAPPPAAAPPPPADAGTDPRFGTCKEAKANGYGPYTKGVDPEYAWYKDADHDGIDCE
ncbi:MAG TPA: excalibur calcium-binding domain-containing protein [Cellulomonas sp.]